MDTLYIVMPAYNEEENIKQVIEKWYAILESDEVNKNSRLVIADSGSVDRTHKLLKESQRTYTKIDLLSHTEKQHGPKVIALYDYALRQNADWIFQTDSDGQTNPDEFKNFWALRSEYDVILGERKVRGDGRFRAFTEYVVCMLLKLYFGVHIKDANAPFRLMKANVVKKYLHRLPPDYNLPNIILTTYFSYYHEKMCFQEISFKPRQGGKNSINFFKIIQIGWKALGDFRYFKKNI